MRIEMEQGDHYRRPRFQLVSGLSDGPRDRVGDARVELIAELIVELTHDHRVQLARRLAEIDDAHRHRDD